MAGVYSVAQVNSYIKNMFAQDFLLRRLSVKGEVSNCKYHSSGHIYFTLKDGGGTLQAVMFASQRRGLNFKLAEGQQVVVKGTVDYPPNGVANFAIMLMLMSLRKAGHILKRGEAQDYSLQGKIGRDISTCTVGVIGTGRIGRTVLQHLSGFGCRLLAYDLYPNDEVKKIAEYVPLETLLAESDVITLHTNATEENHHLIDTKAIESMKPGVTIINTARGKLIDSDALIAGLESGKIGAAGLDVLENENGLYYYNRMGDVIPNPELAALRSMPNVILTDHTAFYTHEDVESMVRGVLESAVAFEKGQPTRHDVTDL